MSHVSCLFSVAVIITVYRLAWVHGFYDYHRVMKVGGYIRTKQKVSYMCDVYSCSVCH